MNAGLFGTYGTDRSHPIRVAWREHGLVDPHIVEVLRLFSFVSIPAWFAWWILYGWIVVNMNYDRDLSSGEMGVFFGGLLVLGVVALIALCTISVSGFPITDEERWSFKETIEEASKILNVAPERIFSFLEGESVGELVEEKLVQLACEVQASWLPSDPYNRKHITARDKFREVYGLLSHLGLADKECVHYLMLAQEK